MPSKMEQILDEAKVKPSKSKKAPQVRMAVSEAEIRASIDEYYRQDRIIKDATAEKTKAKTAIECLAKKLGDNNCVVFDGDKFSVEVSAKHAFSIDQEFCNKNKDFKTSLELGMMPEITLKSTLEIPPTALKKIKDALKLAGMGMLADQIVSSWEFTTNAEKTRKFLTESKVAPIIKDHITDDVTYQYAAKPKPTEDE